MIGETPAQRHFISTNPDWTVLGLNLGRRLVAIVIIILFVVVVFVVAVVSFRCSFTAIYLTKCFWGTKCCSCSVFTMYLQCIYNLFTIYALRTSNPFEHFVLLPQHFPQFVFNAHYGCVLQFLELVLSRCVAQVLSE
jgi:hypothetical protein